MENDAEKEHKQALKSRLYGETEDENEQAEVLKETRPPRPPGFGRVVAIVLCVLVVSIAVVVLSAGSGYLVSGIPYLGMAAVFHVTISLCRCCQTGLGSGSTSFMKRMQGILSVLHPIFYSLFTSVVMMGFLPYQSSASSTERFAINTSMTTFYNFIAPFTNPDDPQAIAQFPYTVAALVLSGILLYFQATFQVQILAQGDIGYRSLAYQYLVAMPAAFGFTLLFSSLFILPVAAPFSFLSPGLASGLLLVPLFFTLVGFSDTCSSRREYVRIDPNAVLKHFNTGNVKTNNESESKPQRVPRSLYRTDSQGFAESAVDGLKIIQVTDPHFCTFTSVKKMRRICEDIVERDPDLVLLTGDFYCVESHYPGCMLSAFSPLQQLSGKTFACLGNHDKETAEVLRLTKSELKQLGVQLLIDDEAVVDTRVGRVQIVLLNFKFGLAGAEHARNVSTAIPKRKDCITRITMLHDPGAFHAIPKDIDTAVFSGHTHGGQVGLVSFGIPLTLVGSFTGHPDFGLWSHGLNTLYVHRGQGFRTMGGQLLMRVGVPAEHSEVVIIPRNKTA